MNSGTAIKKNKCKGGKRMYTKEEMFVSVKGVLANAVQTVDFSNANKANEVYNGVVNVLHEARLLPNVPDFISVITIRSIGDDIESVKVTLKTRVKDMVGGSNLKSTTVIPMTPAFKDLLVTYVENWIDDYFLARKANVNVQLLNSVVEPLCGDIKVSFAYSNNTPIVDITNKSIVLGVSAEALSELSTMELFSNIEYVQYRAKEVMMSTLQGLTIPQEVLTVKNRSLKQLGVTTRKGVAKLLKKVYKKNIKDMAEAMDRENAKKGETAVSESPVCSFEYADDAGKFYGLMKCIKTDSVAEGMQVVYEKDGYSYVIVLSPFDKKMQVLSDDDTAVLLAAIL